MKKVLPRKMNRGQDFYVGIKLNLGSIHDNRLEWKYFVMNALTTQPLHRTVRYSFVSCYVLLQKPRITNKPVGATVTHSGNKYLLNIF